MAAAPASPTPTMPSTVGVPLPVIGPRDGGRSGISRNADRKIAFGGLAVSAVYLTLAIASLMLPAAARLGAWLPVHLALAGAASTAIAAILPFFSAALVAGRPAPPWIRILGVALVAGGALGVMVVVAAARGAALPAAAAGGSFLTGLGFVAVATFLPLRGALGPRYALLQRAYATALVNVTIGATVATLLIGGNQAVNGAWAMLKPAHAWLNLVGFAGLVIIATLVHLAPTVAGTRIQPRLSSRIAIVGIALGAPAIAAGYAASWDLLARAGAVAVLGGAAGIAIHGWTIALDPGRGHWTTDFGWHRLTTSALVMGQTWLGLGFAVAAARVLWLGADPAAWNVTLLLGSLVVGGVLQILVGAMTHLLPAIGPGDPLRHASQRRLLGRFASVRIGGLNAGAALVTVGFGPTGGLVAPGATNDQAMIGLGLVCAGSALGASLVLLLAAARRPGGQIEPTGVRF